MKIDALIKGARGTREKKKNSSAGWRRVSAESQVLGPPRGHGSSSHASAGAVDVSEPRKLPPRAAEKESHGKLEKATEE